MESDDSSYRILSYHVVTIAPYPSYRIVSYHITYRLAFFAAFHFLPVYRTVASSLIEANEILPERNFMSVHAFSCLFMPFMSFHVY